VYEARLLNATLYKWPISTAKHGLSPVRRKVPGENHVLPDLAAADGFGFLLHTVVEYTASEQAPGRAVSEKAAPEATS
jgi:hypothetical protein